MSMSLLNGLRVVEVSCTPRAGFCGKMLVDAGAEVIKLSLPGDEGPGAFSNWLDRGKESVVLDWRTDEGARLLSRLLGSVDVLVSDIECEGPAGDLAAAAANATALVHVSTSDLGHSGPFAERPSSDLIVAALSGMCYINGEAGRLPLREPGNQARIVAGIAAYLGVLAAVINRGQSGKGQAVEVSALEALVNVLNPSVLQSSYQDGQPRRQPSAQGFLVDCADGRVSIITSAQRSWDTILDLWGITPSAEDAPRFTEGERRKHHAEIRAFFAPVLASRDRQDVFEEMCAVRVPAGMLMSPADLLTDRHLLEREAFDALAGAEGPARTFPGPGFRVAGERPGADRGVPTFGADTASLLASLATEEVRA